MNFTHDDLQHFIRACGALKRANETVHSALTADRTTRRAAVKGASLASLIEWLATIGPHMDIAQDIARELIRQQDQSND